MKENTVNKCVKLVVSVLCMLLISCSNDTNVVDVDNVDIVDMNEIRSNIRVLPIKCGFPMDEIYRSIAYDDYIFSMGLSFKKIYCIRNDTVLSVLDASGRGRGEYTSINDFAYSHYENILYVSADGKLLKYTVPDMEFIGSTDFSMSSSTMIVLNNNEILLNGSFMEDNQKDVYRGFCRISSKTGELLERCYDLDFATKKMLMPWDLTPVPGGFVFPGNSFTRNSILFFDLADGSTKELFSFSFNKKWKVPKRLVKLAKKDPMLYAMEDYKETRRLEGGHFPCVTDSALVFWCFPIEGDNGRQVAVIVKEDNVTCRSYTIGGTDVSVSPSFLHNGFCVDFINTSSFDNVDETSLSPFGIELKRIAEAQPFDNPVLLYFKVD